MPRWMTREPMPPGQALGGFTYSKSTGSPSTPLAGAATQLATLPGAYTPCMSDLT
jgi:hypothetical protein